MERIYFYYLLFKKDICPLDKYKNEKNIRD